MQGCACLDYGSYTYIFLQLLDFQFHLPHLHFLVPHVYVKCIHFLGGGISCRHFSNVHPF